MRDSKLAFGITAFVSVAGVIYLWMNLIGVDPQHLHRLTQRVFSSINSLWPALMAILLLRKSA
jgi:hypothetical protein